MADDPPSPFLRPQQLSQSPSVSLPLQPEHSQSPVISTGPTGDYCGYQAEDCAEYPDARLSPSAFAAALNDLVAEAATSTGVNGVKSVAWPIGALELGVGACDAGGDENSGNAAMGGRPTEESTGNESRVVWGTAIGKLSDASPGELEDGELANSPTLAPLWKWQNVSAPEKGSGPSRTGFVPLPQGSVLDKGHQAAVPEGPPPFSSFVDLQLPSLAVTPPASTIQFKSAARRFSVAHLPGARFEYHSSPTPDPRLRKKASQNPTGLFSYYDSLNLSPQGEIANGPSTPLKSLNHVPQVRTPVPCIKMEDDGSGMDEVPLADTGHTERQITDAPTKKKKLTIDEWAESRRSRTGTHIKEEENEDEDSGFELNMEVDANGPSSQNALFSPDRLERLKRTPSLEVNCNGTRPLLLRCTKTNTIPLVRNRITGSDEWFADTSQPIKKRSRDEEESEDRYNRAKRERQGLSRPIFNEDRLKRLERPPSLSPPLDSSESPGRFQPKKTSTNLLPLGIRKPRLSKFIQNMTPTTDRLKGGYGGGNSSGNYQRNNYQQKGNSWSPVSSAQSQQSSYSTSGVEYGGYGGILHDKSPPRGHRFSDVSKSNSNHARDHNSGNLQGRWAEHLRAGPGVHGQIPDYRVISALGRDWVPAGLISMNLGPPRPSGTYPLQPATHTSQHHAPPTRFEMTYPPRLLAVPINLMRYVTAHPTFLNERDRRDEQITANRRRFEWVGKVHLDVLAMELVQFYLGVYSAGRNLQELAETLVSDKPLATAARFYSDVLLVPVETASAYAVDANVFKSLIGAYVESSKDSRGAILPEKWWELKCWYGELFGPTLGEITRNP